MVQHSAEPELVQGTPINGPGPVLSVPMLHLFRDIFIVWLLNFPDQSWNIGDHVVDEHCCGQHVGDQKVADTMHFGHCLKKIIIITLRCFHYYSNSTIIGITGIGIFYYRYHASGHGSFGVPSGTTPSQHKLPFR